MLPLSFSKRYSDDLNQRVLIDFCRLQLVTAVSNDLYDNDDSGGGELLWHDEQSPSMKFDLALCGAAFALIAQSIPRRPSSVIVEAFLCFFHPQLYL